MLPIAKTSFCQALLFAILFVNWSDAAALHNRFTPYEGGNYFVSLIRPVVGLLQKYIAWVQPLCKDLPKAVSIRGLQILYTPTHKLTSKR